jgi:hypothetical protein
MMTDGERLVWAASYALVFERVGDPVVAIRAAASAIAHLRDAAIRRAPDGSFVISQLDERDFVDEIVTVP